jgi:hypothetical protein
MKSALTIFALSAGILLLLGSAPAFAATCPTTSFTNTDCGFILTIGPNNVITGTVVPGALPYEGSDDTLVGVINNSGATFNGSITLSSGVPIFGFEGDGICTIVTATYCATAVTGYEGPLNTFSGINGAGTSGMVNFTGLANGATTYFSLELAPADITGGGGIGVPTGAPEPGALVLLGSGLLGLLGMFRKKLSH